ncbi:hypothetical protein [Deinococcus pimensis]|uniref:hypothetical protein n=1 Tax=Deinococcus pimensis TaxID=309888 RepID=UPI0004887F39|nr:hypothetical protein [Deinococcus pimensis]
MTSVRPFRWDLSRSEGLVHVMPSEPPALPAPEDLRVCAARVLSLAGDADLMFVGRSPESLHDYLRGVLHDTAWARRLDLLLFSARGWPLGTIRREYPHAVTAMRAQFAEAGLAPWQLIRRARPVVFVDLVASGDTFGRIDELLVDWSAQLRLDPRAWRSRVRFVGIVHAQPSSPNAWRWTQRVDWVHAYPAGSVRNVSVPWPLWDFLGNRQAKVTPSNPPSRWGDETLLAPPRAESNLVALHAAARLYELGRTDRARFAALLARQPAMRESWCRALVRTLRARPEHSPTP